MGGAYDFSHFLGQPHPFAAPGQAATAPTYRPAIPSRTLTPAMPTPTDEIPVRGYRAAAPPPPAPPVPYRPPSRQTAGAATYPTATTGDAYRDASDGWFDRLYVSLGGGAVISENLDGKVGGLPYSVDLDLGYAVDAAIGTYFTRAFRGELAFTYRASDSSSATIGGVGAGSANLTTYSFMANGYYDFLTDWTIHPYLGAGVGLDILSGEGFSAGGLSVSGKEGVEIGYQLIGGLAWEFSPTLAVTLDYRYHASSDEDVVFHTILGGLRYNF
jgi:opacity protein-like surface antigen